MLKVPDTRRGIVRSSCFRPCGGRDAGARRRDRPARRGAVADQSRRRAGGEIRLRRADDRSQEAGTAAAMAAVFTAAAASVAAAFMAGALPFMAVVSAVAARAVFRGGGYRYGAAGFVGHRHFASRHAFFHHRHHFRPRFSCVVLPELLLSAYCRIVWTYYGPRRVCRLSPVASPLGIPPLADLL